MQNDRLEEFLKQMSDKEKRPYDVLVNEEDQENRRELLDLMLPYLNESYATTVWATAEKKEPEQRETIMENLIGLYPLSRPLVLHILENVPQSDGFFVRGADIEGRVYKQMKTLLSQMEATKTKNGESMSSKFQSYKKDIESLEKEVEKKLKESKTLDGYINQINELKEKKAKLEEQMNPEKRTQKVEGLRAEIAELEKKKEAYDKEVEKYRAHLRKIKQELEKLQDDNENITQKKQIRDLLKTFPVDEGGDDA